VGLGGSRAFRRQGCVVEGTVAWALYKTYGRMSGSIGVAGVSRVEVAGEALKSDADLPRGRH
jgi:hypothetical protein